MIDHGSAPTVPSTVGELTAQLRALRLSAGSPSFAEITRRVTQLRIIRGLPESEAQIGRITVYDCFGKNRKRLDTALVLDIVEALGADKNELLRWRTALQAAQRRADAAAVAWVDDQVPQGVAEFVGRDEHRAAILDSAGAFWISGMPGVGKSQLAFRTAADILARGGAQGVLVADLRGFSPAGPPVDPDAVVSGFLRILGVAQRQLPSTPKERVKALHALLAERPHVVILDDAADAAQVKQIVSADPAFPTLVSSRARPAPRTISGFTPIPLELFTPEESLSLLEAKIGTGRVVAEAPEARALIETTGHLPLAVSVTAAQVAARPEWLLADLVDVAQSRQRSLRLDEAISRTFALSLSALPEDAQTMLRLFAVVPADVLDREAAAALADGLIDDVDEALAVLSSHHLLTHPRPDVFAMHQLLRLHVADVSLDTDPPSWRNAAARRLVDHLVSRSWSAYTARVTALGEVARTPPRGHTIEELSEDVAGRFFEIFTELLLSLAHGSELTGHAPAIALDISETLGGWLHRGERYDEALALHAKALVLADELGDTEGRVRALADIGTRLATLGRFDEAEKHLRRALPVAEDYPREAVSIYNVLGVVVDRTGEMDEAAGLYRRSIELADTLGDLYRCAHAWSNLAGAYMRTDRLDECEVALGRSVELAQQLGDEIGAARGQTNLASLKLERGDNRAAAAIAQEAAARFETLGIRGGVVFSCSNVAAALLLEERPEEALPWLEKGLALCADGSLPQHATLLHTRLSMYYRALGDMEKATAEAEEGLRIADEIGEMHAKAAALFSLAETRLAAQDTTGARDLWHEALQIRESTGDLDAAEEIRERLRELAA